MIKHEFIKIAREPTYSFASFARLNAKYSIFFHKIGFQGRACIKAKRREATYRGEKYVYLALHSPCV